MQIMQKLQAFWSLFVIICVQKHSWKCIQLMKIVWMTNIEYFKLIIDLSGSKNIPETFEY